jgi:sugar phosphate isomerase/epimerase
MRHLTRRDVVRGAAAGATLAAGLQAAAQEGAMDGPHPADALGFGTVTYNIAKDLDLETLLRVAEDVGLDAVELRTTHAHGVEPSLSATERAEVRARFEARPVTLAALGSVCEFHSPDSAEVARNIEEARRFIQLAQDVGARGVKVRPNGLPEGVPVEKTLEQIGEALNVVGSTAADSGIVIYVEVHGGGTQEPRNMARIMEVCQHPAVGLTWNCNDADMIDGSIRENFALLRPRVRMVHLHELVSGYPYREELLPYLLDPAMGFDGYCLAEAEGLGDPVRFLRYYKALFRSWAREAYDAIPRG